MTSKAPSTFFFKKLWIYVYPALASWKTQILPPFITWKYSSIWRHPCGPTFSFLGDKQLQIPYLFLMFCSSDTPWPLPLSPGFPFASASLKNEPRTEHIHFLTLLNGQRDRCSVNERLHCGHGRGLRLTLTENPLVSMQRAYMSVFTMRCSFLKLIYDLKLLDHYLLNFKDCLSLRETISHLWLHDASCQQKHPSVFLWNLSKMDNFLSFQLSAVQASRLTSLQTGSPGHVQVVITDSMTLTLGVCLSRNLVTKKKHSNDIHSQLLDILANLPSMSNFLF